MMQVRPERSGWRDEGISRRHRLWGWDVPAVDIDFLLLEYDRGKPVAVVEYKHQFVQKVDVNHPSYRALATMADRADLYFFVVFYAQDYSGWHVYAANSKALRKLPEPKAWTEKQYVTFLYELRGRVAPTQWYEPYCNVAQSTPKCVDYGEKGGGSHGLPLPDPPPLPPLPRL